MNGFLRLAEYCMNDAFWILLAVATALALVS